MVARIQDVNECDQYITCALLGVPSTVCIQLFFVCFIEPFSIFVAKYLIVELLVCSYVCLFNI